MKNTKCNTLRIACFAAIARGCLLMGVQIGLSSAQAATDIPSDLMSGIVAMYVHEEWQDNNPYSARTWTVGDWRGYADGLHKIGYNTIVIWPMLETMPEPLTRSDVAALERHARVIDMLHHEFSMRVLIVLTPNIAATESAAAASFNKRDFFPSAKLINPENALEVQHMIAWREHLLSHLKAADGLIIIDGDPGGYPNAHSTNLELISLLKMHRELLDRLRPGIELDYWAHVGWGQPNREWATGRAGKEADKKSDLLDILSELKQLNPAPWGIASMPWQRPYVEDAGLASRMISFTYACPKSMCGNEAYPGVEVEPSLPMTNFGDDAGFKAGSSGGPRGVIAAAHTHIVQLPNTLAFVYGALGMRASESDYVNFANRLIRGNGALIVNSWSALAGTDVATMKRLAGELRTAAHGNLALGDLNGLLFGNGSRFLNDLAMQLNLKASFTRFLEACKANIDVRQNLQSFIAAAEDWDRRTGYRSMWGWLGTWPGMWDALGSLHSSDIDRILGERAAGPGSADPQGVMDYYGGMGDFTPRLLNAMRAQLTQMQQ